MEVAFEPFVPPTIPTALRRTTGFQQLTLALGEEFRFPS